MNSTPVTYQIIDHTADLGIIVKGPDVKSLFILAAQAMTDLIVEGDIGDKIAVKDVFVKGEDFPDLMVRLLREYRWKQRFESVIPGWNSRLAEIQAAILRVRLRYLDRDNKKCAKRARRYREELDYCGLL